MTKPITFLSWQVFTGLVALGCLASCTQTTKEPIAQPPSAEEVRLQDSIQVVQNNIAALEQLSAEDLVQRKYERLQHEDYSNQMFNNTLPSAQFRFGRGRRTVKAINLYEGPSDSTQLLAQIPINEEVRLISQTGHWRNIAWDGKEGYVPKMAIGDNHIPYDDEGIDFLTHISSYGPHGREEMVTMLAIERSTKKVLGSLEVPFRVKEYWVSRSTSALKNAGYILSLNFTRSSCPGHEENYHYAYQDGVFTEVAHSFGMGEAGYYSYNTVFLPIRFENNVVLHMANANAAYATNWTSGDIEAAVIPDTIAVPLHQLVIIKSGQGAPETDEYGTPILDENGMENAKSLGSAVHYYRWDGSKLELYKSTNPGFKAGMI